MKSVLIVDNEPDTSAFLRRGLREHFSMIETATTLEVASGLVERCHFDLIIAEVRLPDGSGVEWLAELRQRGHPTAVIFMAAHTDTDTVIAALQVRALDFLLKPFDPEHLEIPVLRCLKQAQEQLPQGNSAHLHPFERSHDRSHNKHALSNMVGACPEMLEISRIIRHVAPLPSTVLIEGESGTGKELAARAIHELSRRGGNFVSVNCGSMSAELLESELFGHVKGAFTGAHQAREGLFAFANAGTLLLDEIGEMPLAMQVHLLRVLDERSIRPVGANVETRVDVRILAATNRNLADAVKQGHFREDLFYRLNVLSLRMPPLRERNGDMALLAQHFTDKLASELGIERQSLSRQEIQRLDDYRWPGNVRELKNVIERSLLLNTRPGECLPASVTDYLTDSLTNSPTDLPADSSSGTRTKKLTPHRACKSSAYTATGQSAPGDTAGDTAGDTEGSILLEDVEREHILKILQQQSGNKSASARLLGVSRKTMERKLKAWGLF